jgi:hypothetical protein
MSGLVLVAWLWGVFTLSAHAMVTQQSLPSDGENLPGYVVTCSGAHSPPEGARSVGSGDSSGCLREVRSSMSTSRQPGASLTDQVHRGDR